MMGLNDVRMARSIWWTGSGIRRSRSRRSSRPTPTRATLSSATVRGLFFKLPPFLKLTNTDPFAAWFVVTGDATPDGVGSWSHELPSHRGFSRIAVLRG